MSKPTLHCWICMQTDNVNIVNDEWICDECMRELAIIEEEEREKTTPPTI